MQRIANNWIHRGIHHKACQQLWLARQYRGKGRVNIQPRLAQCFNRPQTIGDRFATRLKNLADPVVVGRDRKADPQVGVLGDSLQQMHVAQHIHRPRLQYKKLRRMNVHLFQNSRHHLLVHLSGLIRIGKRRTIDELIGTQLAFE